MTIYKEALLDHYRNPRNRGDLERTRIVRRGRNPLCGDEVEIGINVEGETLTSVRFRGRACSICIASASIMTGMMTGKNLAEALSIIDFMHRWFGKEGSGMRAPEPLQPLSSVRDIQARRNCVLLAWDALTTAISEYADT